MAAIRLDYGTSQTFRFRQHAASFGLFQHSGRAIEWSDIRVRAL